MGPQTPGFKVLSCGIELGTSWISDRQIDKWHHVISFPFGIIIRVWMFWLEAVPYLKILVMWGILGVTLSLAASPDRSCEGPNPGKWRSWPGAIIDTDAVAVVGGKAIDRTRVGLWLTHPVLVDLRILNVSSGEYDRNPSKMWYAEWVPVDLALSCPKNFCFTLSIKPEPSNSAKTCKYIT